MSKERYLIIKENAEAELTTIYVPELDDAAEAVKILTDLKELWKAADACQRNRLLLAVFHSIYVDLENREVVGFQPMKAFYALLQAMDYREDVEVWPTPYGEFTRDGGPPDTVGCTRRLSASFWYLLPTGVPSGIGVM